METIECMGCNEPIEVSESARGLDYCEKCRKPQTEKPIEKAFGLL